MNQAIDAEQESIIVNATKLKTVPVESVMVTRERIAFLQLHKSNIENFELVATTLHTRYPVSETGGIDGIASYVNFKEIVAVAPSRRDVRLVGERCDQSAGRKSAQRIGALRGVPARLE